MHTYRSGAKVDMVFYPDRDEFQWSNIQENEGVALTMLEVREYWGKLLLGKRYASLMLSKDESRGVYRRVGIYDLGESSTDDFEWREVTII